MAVKIRLARTGTKKKPFYHIVVTDVRSPRDSNFLEKIGYYDPLLPHDHSKRIILKSDRLKYWFSVGAKPTTVVRKFCKKLALLIVD